MDLGVGRKEKEGVSEVLFPRHLEIPHPTPETQLVKKQQQVAVTILILFYSTLWEGEHGWGTGVGKARIRQDRWIWERNRTIRGEARRESTDQSLL